MDGNACQGQAKKPDGQAVNMHIARGADDVGVTQKGAVEKAQFVGFRLGVPVETPP